MTLDLSTKQRLDLITSNFAARMGLDRRVVVSLGERDGLYLVDFDGMTLALPTAKRWHRYKRGWRPRGDRMLFQFGVGEVAKISDGDTVIDIGANVGEFSIAVAKLGATVHAIEGDPLVFRCLEANMRAHPGVTTHEAVVWNEETDLTFYSEPTDANSSIFRPDEGVESTPLTVQATTLDALAERLNIGEVSLLKCDAEGAEPEVIKGGEKLLSRVRVCAFDTGDERMGEETSDDCEALLKDLGFRVFHDRRPNRKITFGVRES